MPAVDSSRDHPPGGSRVPSLRIPSMGAVRAALFRFYRATQRALVPGLQNSQAAYKDLLSAYVNPNVKWLDLGCGHQLFPEWLPSTTEDQAVIVARCKTIVGIDYDSRALQKHEAIQR